MVVASDDFKPTSEVCDVAYLTTGDGIYFGYGCIAHAARTKFAYLSHLIFSHCGCPARSRDTPAFAHHIIHVILMRSRENVGRVLAPRKITRMARLKTLGEWTVSKLIGKTVGIYVFPIMNNMPITFRVTSSRPGPTLARGTYGYFLPISLFEGILFHTDAFLYKVLVKAVDVTSIVRLFSYLIVPRKVALV